MVAMVAVVAVEIIVAGRGGNEGAVAAPPGVVSRQFGGQRRRPWRQDRLVVRVSRSSAVLILLR